MVIPFFSVSFARIWGHRLGKDVLGAAVLAGFAVGVDEDAFIDDVAEKRGAGFELTVHVWQRVDDEGYGAFDLAVPGDALFDLVPEGAHPGQGAMADDHEEVHGGLRGGGCGL